MHRCAKDKGSSSSVEPIHRYIFMQRVQTHNKYTEKWNALSFSYRRVSFAVMDNTNNWDQFDVRFSQFAEKDQRDPHGQATADSHTVKSFSLWLTETANTFKPEAKMFYAKVYFSLLWLPMLTFYYCMLLHIHWFYDSGIYNVHKGKWHHFVCLTEFPFACFMPPYYKFLVFKSHRIITGL